MVQSVPLCNGETLRPAKAGQLGGVFRVKTGADPKRLLRTEEHPAKTKLTANFIQETTEDAIQVGWMTGCSPRFTLHGVSDALHHDGDLEALAKAWSTPQQAIEGLRP